jgi:hypothetical protein
VLHWWNKEAAGTDSFNVWRTWAQLFIEIDDECAKYVFVAVLHRK